MSDHLHSLIVDSFAGGGGASTGIEMALGRSPDIAINHSGPALALHEANHPDTLHLRSDIWGVDPGEVTDGRHVGLMWASPDCKHFSKAKGGSPRDRNIRDLAWAIIRWAEHPTAAPDVICMENVEEFVTWGPVDEDGRPVKEFAGITYELWLKHLRRAGYRFASRELRACDYGAPTIRKRWFLIARRDGQPIRWPKPTHGDPDSAAVRAGRVKPWRTAAEIIDWALPCPSIFATASEIMAEHGLRAVRPLARNTLARIARGMQRYVLEAERPFLVSLKGSDRRDRPADAPHPTILAGGGHSALISPSLTRFNGGATGRDLRDPAPTITANSYITRPGGAAPLGVLAAGLVHIGNGERAGQAPRALDPRAPLGTVVASGARQYPFSAFLAQQNGGPRMADHAGRDPDEPLSTVTARGSQQTPIAAFLAKYYGAGTGARHDEPCHTVTVNDRFGHVQASLAAPPFGPEHEPRARQVAEMLREHGAWEGGEFVTLAIEGQTFVVVDIGLRMLTPRELFNAQGFPPDYQIAGATIDGKWRAFTKSVQVSCVGNSVCPPIAAAIVGANCPHLARKEAAA